MAMLTMPSEQMAHRTGVNTPTAGVSFGVIGRSEKGRPIEVLRRGRPDAPLRVLVMAGQHGDEAHARTAVRRFAEQGFDVLSTPGTDTPPPVALVVVLNLNPDGTARATRENACGIDLNRDHALLESASNQALHAFVRDWKPHLVVDTHTYPPRRAHLLDNGLIYCHDVFLDVPNNPSVHHPALAGGTQSFFDAVTSGLHTAGYRSARYTIINGSGRVRHSTPDVIDARNALALRYGCLTVLLEGRRPARTDAEATYAPPDEALLAGLQQVVTWAMAHQRMLTMPTARLNRRAQVIIQSQYRRADAPRTMAFEDADTGVICDVTLPGKYTPHVESKRRVRLPRAYAVPHSHKQLLNVLERHGFFSHSGRPGHCHCVEHTRIDRVKHSTRAYRAPRKLSIDRRRRRRTLTDHQFFPVTRCTARALAVLLEAESKYGLHRFEKTGLTMEDDTLYPVLRVL